MIPALALIPILAGAGGTSDDWAKIALKVAAFGGMLIGGRFLLGRCSAISPLPACARSSPAAALLLVLGSALFMETLGLSMALGTFIAGVLLAESEYRHELEISIRAV